jgi:hypothetical protein
MLDSGVRCALNMRATFAALWVALALLGCHDPETAAVIEVQSDLGTSLTRVDIDIRDAQDHVSGDHFSFDAEANPSYRVPFSFRITRHAASEFVIKASGYDHADYRTEMKMRVRLVEGQTLRRTLFLWAACAHTQCDDGLTCNPIDHSCQPISESSTPAESSRGFDGGTAGADAAAADGGQVSGAAGGGGRPPDGADAGQSPAAGSGGAKSAAGSGGEPAKPTHDAGVSGAGGAPGASDAGDLMSTDTDAGPDNRGRLARKQWTHTEHAGRGYVVWNNVVYDDADETLSFDETAFTVTNVITDHPDGAAFPAVYIGSLYYMDSDDGNLPKQVSAIRSLDLTFSNNADQVSGAFNAITSAWFNLTAERQGDVATGGFLEVWFYPRSDQPPIGTMIQQAATVAGVAGQWDVWFGSDAGLFSMTYRRTEPITSFDGDLNPFFVDASQRPSGLPSTWYLAALSTGFAIASGGNGLHADAISMIVQ